MNIYKIPICIALIGLLSTCNYYTNKIEDANDLILQGQYEAALIEFIKLEKKYPNRYDVKAGLGRLFSLKRATLFAGLDYLERAYIQNHDPILWKDLLLLYIDLQQYENALKLLQEPYVDLDRLFSAELIRWRTGLSCLNNRDYHSLRNLENLEDHADKRYFYILCLEKYPQKYKDKDELILTNWNLLVQDSRQTACELANVLPPDYNIGETNMGEFLKECQKQYLSNFAIQREYLGDLYDNVRDQKILFHTRRFETEDPGRDDVPPWPAGRQFNFSH